MAFTEEQVSALTAPLDTKNVKSRVQGGRNVSYIEGWQALAEANRIFGFDAWSRESMDVKCVSERERKIGQTQKDGWGVTYICRARITVGGIIREGCGTGHGIDVDLGQAHESAIKEAETDATKRALMTFGWQFGLALYDKTQEHVSNGAAKAPARLTKQSGRALYSELQDEVRKPETIAALAAWWSANQARIETLPLDWEQHIVAEKDRIKKLMTEGQAA